MCCSGILASMPRATRYLVEGYLYHLTHRSADGAYFLRFTKEQDVYREWLRVGVNRYHVSALGYMVTCNHTHVVSEVRDRLAVTNMMRLAVGSVEQQRNVRKGHEGSVWEHPYHCRTSIEDRLAARSPVREPCWTEAVAVGSEGFVDAAVRTTSYRRHMQCYAIHSDSIDNAWAVYEPGASYGTDSDP